MRKMQRIIFLLLGIGFCFPRVGYSQVSLPVVAGWQMQDVLSAELSTVSGNHGYWQEKVYRTENGIAVKAILLTGKGPGTLRNLSDNTHNNNDVSETGNIYEHCVTSYGPAIFESHPVLGQTLTLVFNGNILSVETQGYSVDQPALIGIAETVIASMNM